MRRTSGIKLELFPQTSYYMFISLSSLAVVLFFAFWIAIHCSYFYELFCLGTMPKGAANAYLDKVRLLLPPPPSQSRFLLLPLSLPPILYVFRSFLICIFLLHFSEFSLPLSLFYSIFFLLLLDVFKFIFLTLLLIIIIVISVSFSILLCFLCI